MPRPTARVLSLLEILQTGGTHTAAELAGRLAVDERTVRRYVRHLIDLDVPVWTERGRYGGFRLAPGYRMPPLMLTDDEALAVLVGLAAAEPTTATESATAKIRRVLPQRLGQRLGTLLENAGFTARRRSHAPPETDVLLLFAEAARERRAVQITYRSADGRTGERTLHPYGVVAHAGRWYVTAADSVSGQDRTFRLDRVRAAALLPETFATTDERDPGDHLLELLATAPRRHPVQVLVQSDIQHVRRRVPAGLATFQADGDRVRIRLQVEELDWVPSLLAWIDRPFVIEEPDALREHVRALADRLLRSAEELTP